MKLSQTPHDGLKRTDLNQVASRSTQITKHCRKFFGNPLFSVNLNGFNHFCSGRHMTGKTCLLTPSRREEILMSKDPFFKMFHMPDYFIDVRGTSDQRRTFLYFLVVNEKEKDHIVSSLEDSGLFVLEKESEEKNDEYTVIISGSAANFLYYLNHIYEKCLKEQEEEEKRPKTPFEIFFKD